MPAILPWHVRFAGLNARILGRSIKDVADTLGVERTPTLRLRHERHDDPHENDHADQNHETSNHLASEGLRRTAHTGVGC